jgi:hypothetical protein
MDANPLTASITKLQQAYHIKTIIFTLNFNHYDFNQQQGEFTHRSKQ